MSVKMKRMDMVTLWNLLNKLSSENLPGRVFKIFTSKNILVIKPEIELIQENFKSPEGVQEYETKKRDILLKYADRDEKNAIMFEGNNFRITVPENVKKAQEEVAALDAEHADLVKEIESINKEFLEYSKETIELNLMKLTESAIPDDINNADLTTLIELGLLAEV